MQNVEFIMARRKDQAELPATDHVEIVREREREGVCV